MRRLMILALCLVSLVGLASVAWAAYSYSQCEPRMTNAVGDVDRYTSGYASASAQVMGLVNGLTAMPTTYKDLIDTIAANIAATPNDAEWKGLNGRLAKVVTDYNALLTKATVAKNAFAAIESKGYEKVQAALDGIQ